jgi:hypothetical protein
MFSLFPWQHGISYLLKIFTGTMTPQLVPSNVFGLNLIDIDCSLHLSPKTDQVCHARLRPSVKTWRILRFQRIFGFHGSTIDSLTVSGLNLIDIDFIYHVCLKIILELPCQIGKKLLTDPSYIQQDLKVRRSDFTLHSSCVFSYHCFGHVGILNLLNSIDLNLML